MLKTIINQLTLEVDILGMPMRKIFKYLVLLFLVFFILQAKGYLSGVEYWLSEVFTPVAKTFYRLGQGVRRGSAWWLNRKNLYTENQNLRAQVIAFTLAEAQLKLVQVENAHLRQELNFLKKQPRFVMAEVVGKSSDDLVAALVIDRGARDGLALGDPVIVDEGIFVGKIFKITDSISLVRLLTDNQSKIAATILSKDQTLGVVSGRHGTSLLLEMIPQNETVVNGELIVTSGLDNLIPRGLLIGKVDFVSKDPYEPFQRATITPLVRIDKINVVAVLVGE